MIALHLSKQEATAIVAEVVWSIPKDELTEKQLREKRPQLWNLISQIQGTFPGMRWRDDLGKFSQGM